MNNCVMDLSYMPGSLPYGIIRPPMIHLDYEQPWNTDYFHLGKPPIRTQKQYQQQVRASREQNRCELCRNSKRRSLAAYIRNKSKVNSCNEIHEEEEEENIDGDKINNFDSKTINNTTEMSTTNTITTIKKINDNTNKPKKSSRFNFRFKIIK